MSPPPQQWKGSLAKTLLLLLLFLGVKEREFNWQEGIVVRAEALRSDGPGFKS